jgi:hypothetical protein
MAAPNIVNVATITGKTTYLTPADTNAAVLLANSSGSNKVFKINSLVASNVDGTNARDVTVAINTAAAGSGTGYPIVSTVSVPADASLVVINKENPLYLEEDKSIVVISGSADDIAFTISYEEIS